MPQDSQIKQPDHFSLQPAAHSRNQEVPLSPQNNPHTPIQKRRNKFDHDNNHMSNFSPSVHASDFKTPEVFPRTIRREPRGEVAVTREQEKSVSDISALSAFGPSLDR